ncbi:ubiquitin-protein ligase [Lithospermum erythrorhizon]|uniref:Ubiquitin-protein ligase n=1 Tax=Lithospermum erythrorhizon TaxID=34254 RepID=A0AAV3PTX3_LITER
MSFFPSLPPPPPFSATTYGGMSGTTPPQQQQVTYSDSNNNNNDGFIVDNNNASSSSPSFTRSIVVTSIVISTAIIISATIYILLRFLSRRSNPSHAPPHNSTLQNHINISSSSSNNNNINESDNTVLLDSLPLLTFRSVNGNLTGKDCAVCLSKFEKEDQLRLLPLCCHAFHSQCVDTWLLSNQSCPLCRSTVNPTDADVMNKVISLTENVNIDDNINNSSSFGVETSHNGRARRSQSEGSFEYNVDDNHEIPSDFRGVPDVDKDTANINVIDPPGVRLDNTEIGASQRNWLRDYVERFASISFSSRNSSFRSSGRFFSGSCRRNDAVVPVDEDLEASNSRAGEDISELFRWISGV